MMKTRILFIALAIFIGIADITNAQKKDVQVYGFVYSYYKAYEYKDIYFSCIVSGVKNSSEFIDPVPNALGNQWSAKVKSLFEDYYKLNSMEYAWFESYDDVDSYRTKLMGEYRQKGFSIHVVDDFYFKKTKKNSY
jgi:hypothetical protein